ncbi:MAG: response regulator [Fidelibacterota bacterium]
MEALSKKLLIVDDFVDLLEIYKEFFEMSGFSVKTAVSGEEALEIFNDFSPDVIITDISMPEMSGVDLAKKVLESNPDQKIIFMTGLDPDAESMRFIESNNYPFFSKTSRLKEVILKKIFTVLGEKR